MQQVSDEWKLLHTQNILPISEIKIELNISTIENQNVVYTANDSAYVSNLNYLNQNISESENYPNLELNNWGLDGSVDTYSWNESYVSESICDSSGAWTTNPIITMTFDSVITDTHSGLHIEFANGYATKFNIELYDDNNTLLDTINVTSNTDTTLNITQDITGFKYITLEIIEWSKGNTHAKVKMFMVGLYKVFYTKDLISFKHSQSGDLNSLSLPKNYIQFTIENKNDEYNPDNPSGIYQYLSKREKLVVHYGYQVNGEIEYIKCGTFYLDDWNVPQNGYEVTFSARDVLLYCDKTFDTTNLIGTTITLYNLCVEALRQADTPSEAYYGLSAKLQQYSVSIETLTDYTCAEILQLCANATGLVMWQDRDGILNITTTPTTQTYGITRLMSYTNGEYTLSNELLKVVVNEGQAEVSYNTGGDIQEIVNPFITTNAQATMVGQWVGGVLNNRKTISGEFRPDIRGDVYDNASVTNKYSTISGKVVEIVYTFESGFKGQYVIKIME